MTLEQVVEQIVRKVLREELARAPRNMAPEPPQLLTIKAYAASRSISVTTVRAAIRDGRLATTLVGRGIARTAHRIAADADIAPRCADTPEARGQRILRGGRP